VIFYVITVLVFALNVFEFNADNYSVMLGIALFIAGLGLAFSISSSTKHKAVAVLGMLALSVLFIFPIYFLTVFLGWTLAINL